MSVDLRDEKLSKFKRVNGYVEVHIVKDMIPANPGIIVIHADSGVMIQTKLVCILEETFLKNVTVCYKGIATLPESLLKEIEC